ncbi:hypothetical protein BGX31_003579 [Mortierella sp. GBA43]|nr:hypothetical protein BGX31_003579 [Mortierella sp. GBA43]
MGYTSRDPIVVGQRPSLETDAYLTREIGAVGATGAESHEYEYEYDYGGGGYNHHGNHYGYEGHSARQELYGIVDGVGATDD